MKREKSAFEKWLYQPDPVWMKNLENCNEDLFSELNMSREQIESLLEKLDEYKIFEEK